MSIQTREFQWGTSQPLSEHFAGDLGVDAFVPVGKAVVAEEGKEAEGGEGGGEGGGVNVMAAEGIWWGLEFRGHDDRVREVRW